MARRARYKLINIYRNDYIYRRGCYFDRQTASALRQVVDKTTRSVPACTVKSEHCRETFEQNTKI